MDICFKLILILSLAFPPANALASQWGMHAQYAGFMGEAALGPALAFNTRHALELSVGQYKAGSAAYHQLNFGYLYSPWALPVERRYSWVPLNVGLFVLWSLNSSQDFVEVPDRYPTSNYYEQRGLRPALRLGTGLAFAAKKLEADFHIMILDSAFAAYSNNDREIAEYFMSSGLGLKLYF